jgi:hypothetical protein
MKYGLMSNKPLGRFLRFRSIGGKLLGWFLWFTGEAGQKREGHRDKRMVLLTQAETAKCGRD